MVLNFGDFELFLIILLFLLMWLIVINNRRLVKRQEEAALNKLKKAQDHVQAHIINLDNLVSMLTKIHEFGMAAIDINSRDELSQSVIGYACKLVNSKSGSFMLIDPLTSELTIISSRGLPKEVAENTRMRLGEGIAGRVAKTGKPIFVKNIEQDERFLRSNSNQRYSSPSFVSVPLRVKDKVVGVLNVNSPTDSDTFEEMDMRLLSILADQTAVMLENIDLYNNIQSFYFEMIQTLARTLDAKDSYTHDHADRARRYTRLICAKLHLPEPLIKHIEYAALMHDIGKIGISEKVLNKEGKLTDEEFEEIKEHPSIGNRILEPVTFLSPVAPIVLYHHEWYNGRGYPAGLAGEEIPLGSRIVAVIDAYDAMISERPYRKALSKETAIKELVAGKGTQFDPKVVDIFLEVLKEEEQKVKR
ncbi:HD domain-containing phosphohydrolase [Elusimicrobiota bacterium]